MIHRMVTTTFEKFLSTLQENSKTVRNTYISFLTLTTFIWITIESVTHRMLLIPDENLTLPLIQVKIPIVGFFWAAPFLLVLFQLYFQVHVFRFARDLAKVRDDAEKLKKEAEENGNRSQVSSGAPAHEKGEEPADSEMSKPENASTDDQNDSITEIPSDWKSQLQGNLFTWNFIDQKSHYETHGVLTSFIVSLSFYWYGVLVLLRVQWVFLPHHHSALTTTHFAIVIFSLATSFYFGLRVWVLRQNGKTKPRNHFRWSVCYVLGYIVAGLGVYFTLVMSWSVLEIPFTEKENERRFGDLSWPVETWLVCFSEGVDETNNEHKNIFVNNRGRNRQAAKENDVSPAELKGTNPCKFLKQLVWFLLDPLNTSHTEYKQWSHFKISEVVARNLNLAEVKLAIGPSDTVKAALIEKERKNQYEEVVEQELLSYFESFNLRGRHLEFANFKKSDLRKADLRGAILYGADMRVTQLQGAKLYSAKLHGADFRGSQIQGGSLGYSQLQGADFYKANLQGSNLRGAQLQGANLNSANLQGADIKFANLEAADLGSGVNGKYRFEAAQLQGANLKEARLQGAIFKDTKVGRLKLVKGDLERWAKGLQRKEAKSFIKRMRENINSGSKTILPERTKMNGEPLLAHNIRSWKKKNKKIPSLVDYRALNRLQSKWNAEDLKLKNLRKKLTGQQKRTRKEKLGALYSKLFKEQRKT